MFRIHNNAETILIQYGQRFVVQLYENLSTDRRWRLNLSPGLTLVDSWYVPTCMDRPLDGGMHLWSIRAEAIGEQDLDARLPCSDYLVPQCEIRFRLKILVE